MIARPRVLIFDLDDTLVDWSQRSRYSRGRTAAALAARTGLSVTDWEQALSEQHLAIWQQIVTGALPHSEHAITRMRAVLASRGYTDPRLLDEALQVQKAAMVERITLEPQIKSALVTLRQHYSLCLLTNGFAEFQWITLRATELHDAFDHIFICSDLQCYKPDVNVFHTVLRQSASSPSEAWMIGDSWPDDIEPALDLGLTTVWINPERKPYPNGRRPHHDVATVLDLLPLLTP